jgi:predicted ATPase/signal transduction histidine kinase
MVKTLPHHDAMSKVTDGTGQSLSIDYPGLRLEPISAGGPFILYRGNTVSGQVMLAIASNDVPFALAAARLKREYTLAGELDSDWALRPIAYVLHDERPMLLLGDPGGDPLDAQLAQGLHSSDWGGALTIACNLAAAIRKMHRQGIIHKDITPRNVFLDRTGHVRLTGFGLAIGRFNNLPSLTLADSVAGTLAYMAPEQTGRMNRPVDTRSDLYALGVTLYELFTGTLPFVANDATEWAHCHIARKPPLPRSRAINLPIAVNAIILKLLAKDPADRYQTAQGVENDLGRCLAAWQATQRVDDFELGLDDISDRLSIPEKLYGRAAALEPLLAAAGRVMQGGPGELILVSGSAGIGKSSLVHELHRSLPRRAMFATGKFDQHKRDVPYATLAQAFGGQVRHLLTKSDSELAVWRKEMLTALEPNAQLMIDLIPDLALILGEQLAAPAVELRSAQARFHLVFRSLMGVFAKPEHPLVFFIDDIQWLDSATLNFLDRLFADTGLRHLLVVGAYRNNEVDVAHPLMRTLESIREARGAVTDVRLNPLTTADLTRLLADCLGADSTDVADLAKILSEKTGGNPFFSVQFVRELASDGLLLFDPHRLKWTWDAAGIRNKKMTDNVAHLIAARLERLPIEARDALCRLALLGSTADLRTIALIGALSPDATYAALRPAVDAGLLRTTDGTYSFVHDHVQEASYALVPSASRSASHLAVGRLLLAQTPPAEFDGRVFEIASQFDRGFLAIDSATEREQIAELYLLAGRRAKSASAFASAQAYFARGRQLLDTEGWPARYRLMFDLELNLAECEIVAGDWSAADARLSSLATRARAIPDRAGVACLALLMHFTLGSSDRAVAVGLDFLSNAGIAWPRSPSAADVREEYDEMHQRLQGLSVEALADMPEMSDPTIVAIMAVLTELFPAAYAVDRHLMDLVLLRMTNMSLQHGPSASTSVAYSALNMVIGSRFSDYTTAISLGALAVRIAEHHKAERYKARVYSCLAAFTMPWTAHIASTQSFMTQALKISSAMGDMAFAAYNLRNHITHVLLSGAPLATVQQETERAIGFAGSIHLGLPADRFFGQWRLIRTLRAASASGGGDDSREDDAWAQREVGGAPGLAMMACYHWVFRLQEHYFAGDIAAALEAAAHLDGRLWAMRSTIEEAEYELFAGLARAAACDGAAPADRDACLAALSAHGERFALWAIHSPENFGCRKALLGAELARLQGRERDAQGLYEEAVRLARVHGFVQIEALSNELAGHFYAGLNLATVADAYLRNAYEGYEHWGCMVKIRRLEQRHPRLRRYRSMGSSATTVDVPLAHFDVQVVDRASKTLSSEMDLTHLIEKLMRLAIEHAGAERGLLLLLDGPTLKIEAEATTEQGAIQVQVLTREPSAFDLPQTAIQYVLRTQAAIVLDNGVSAGLDYVDEYLEQRRPRSILCLPIVKPAGVIGILYLENSMTTRAFTPDRVSVLDFLASQAAIWLDNARLYSDLQRSEAWLREAQHLSHSGSFYWHVPTDVLEFSEEMYRICQIAPEQPMAMRLFESRVHPDDLAEFAELIALARSSGGNLDHKFRLPLPDLSVRHVHLVAHSGRAEHGELKYVGAIQDITGQHLSEQALGKARSELAHVARATTLGVLTASIAHEINQPLLGIVTNATTCLRMLAASPPNIEGARNTAQRSVRDGHRAADIIRRLRSLFSGGGTVSEPTDINEAVREVISLAMNELQSNQVILETRLARGLPLIAADRIQIQQVVLNLLVNASDAMRDLFDRPRKLILGTRLADTSVRIDVRDSGTGFDTETAGRLFEAFYTTKASGMGMGLSISRSIVESHGGRVWATANGDGPGATFSVLLPTKTTSEYAVADHTSASTDHGASEATTGARP